MSRKLTFIMMLAAVVLGVSACEKYEKVAENSAFCIEAAAVPGNPVGLAITVTDGNHAGDCTLEAVITDVAGASPSCRILLNGETEVGPNDTWRFTDDGTAAFTIQGLPEGNYRGTFYVRRWYHSASATISFTVNRL